MASTTTCPNCGDPIEGHPRKGCLLAALIAVVDQRGNRSKQELAKLHAEANASALWDDLGPIIDKLEDGRYSQ